MHLELHTGDLQGAEALYRGLLGWETQRYECDRGSYLELALRRKLALGCKAGPLRDAAKQSGVRLWE